MQVTLHALNPLAPIISHSILVSSAFPRAGTEHTPQMSQLDTYARIPLAWNIQWEQKGTHGRFHHHVNRKNDENTGQLRHTPPSSSSMSPTSRHR
jgi:hypothetical protein